MKKNFTHNLRDAINNCPSRGTKGMMMMREMVITVTLEIEVSSIGL
jgi:tRNA G37 N-methylase TrmD